MGQPRAFYEKPILVKHQVGLFDKFGRLQAISPMTHIDGWSVSDLVEKYGSPLFVFSERTMVRCCRELKELLALRYPKFQLAWSYKTNYLDAICKVFDREGSWAEVVSEFEFEKALRLGIPPSRIIFNGPYKPESALEKGLKEGVRIHIDHFDELSLMEKVADRLRIRPEVGIRINFSISSVPSWDRFGFNLENGQAWTAVKRLAVSGRLSLAGLHCHIGTFILDPNAYREAASRMVDFSNRLRDEMGLSIKWIDLGGGFASINTLHSQYLPGNQVTPSFSQYVEAIAEGLEHLNGPASGLPILLLETGRALIDEAGYLITTVQANKRLSDGRRALVVDTGIHHLVTSNWYRHEVVPAQEFNGTYEPTMICGPLCMNLDVIRSNLLYPPVKTGDRLVIKTVGAYNVTQWMQFITLRPNVVMISRNGQCNIIRHRETLNHIVALEEVPPWI
ncbi:MAG: diaminopimelate decarboxylase [Thermodesulfobacteriota bacterium]|nr:diaminopimelate decarboxylase [Thermodesulfobacteriota bacterium]